MKIIVIEFHNKGSGNILYVDNSLPNIKTRIWHKVFNIDFYQLYYNIYTTST